MSRRVAIAILAWTQLVHSFPTIISGTTSTATLRVSTVGSGNASLAIAPSSSVPWSIAPTHDNSLVVATATASHDSYPSRAPLLPAVHWDHDSGDLRHIAPQADHALYFSSQGTSNPRREHAFAHMNATWSKDVVVLDHSDHIQSVQCDADTITIRFASIAGYDTAKTSWTPGSEFVLATYSSDCGGLDYERSFWDVLSLAFNQALLSVTVDIGEEMGMKDVVDGASMTWGTWTPSHEASNYTGCQPPNKTISGFPTVPYDDPNFDDDLDALIGYLDCDDADFDKCLDLFAPGLAGGSDGASDVPEAPDFSKYRTLRTRLGRRNVGQGIGNVIAGGFRWLGGAISGNEQLKKEANEQIDKGKEQIKVEPEVKLNIPVDIKAPNLVNEPWVNSFSIFKTEDNPGGGSVTGSLEAFCVDCHAKGQLDLAGRAEWSAKDGVKKLEGNIAGQLDAQVAIGILAQITAEKEFEKDIFKFVPPPMAGGINIPGIFSIGPFIALRASAKIGVTVKGQALAGVKLIIPKFEAKLDLIDPGKTTPLEIKPELKPLFEAAAEVSAIAGIGLPIAIGLGIEVPPVKFKKTVELVEKPSIEAEAKAAINVDQNGVSASCPGIDWALRFRNEVYFTAADLVHKDINNFSTDLAKGCVTISIPAKTSASTTATTDSASQSTSTEASGTGSNAETGPSVASTTASETGSSTDAGIATSTEAPSESASSQSADITTTMDTSSPSETASSPDSSSSVEGMTTTDGATTATTESSPEATSSAAAEQSSSTTDASSSPDTPATTSAEPASETTSSSAAAEASSIEATTTSDPGAPASTETPAIPSVLRRRDLSFNQSDFSYVEDDQHDFTSYDIDDEYSDLSDEALSEEDDEDTQDEDGSSDDDSFIQIISLHGEAQLAMDETGNLRITDHNFSGSSWIATEGIVYADESERVLHYYPDTISKLGVSRIRGSFDDQIPQTADLVVLAPAPTGNDTFPYVYVAANTQNETYFIVTCNYEQQPSKVFLVDDLDQGPKTLVEEDLRYIVTGGVVQECIPYLWIAPGAADV